MYKFKVTCFKDGNLVIERIETMSFDSLLLATGGATEAHFYKLIDGWNRMSMDQAKRLNFYFVYTRHF